MKVFVAGGTGFIGRALVDALILAGHQVTVLARRPDKVGLSESGIKIVRGNPMIAGEWQEQVAGMQAVINLTGASIFTRWNQENKKILRDSRVLSTSNIVSALGTGISPPGIFINASAVGYYGFCGEDDRIESDDPGHDFLAQLCVEWEQEAQKAVAQGVRVVTARFSTVLGPGGGALARMLPAFRLGLGGPLGSGRQWFPWIHLDDLTSILLFLLSRETISGPVNCCSPYPITNRQMTSTLGRILHRPAFLPVPGFLLMLILGEVGSVILKGCRIIPGVLNAEGYTFQYPDLESCLRNILE